MDNKKEVFADYSVCSNLWTMENNLNESYEDENILYETNAYNNLTNRNSVTQDTPYGSLGDVSPSSIP